MTDPVSSKERVSTATLQDAIACCGAWEANVRILGNVKAADLSALLWELLERRAAHETNDLRDVIQRAYSAASHRECLDILERHLPAEKASEHKGHAPHCATQLLYDPMPCNCGVRKAEAPRFSSTNPVGPNGECPICGGLDGCKPGCQDGSEVL